MSAPRCIPLGAVSDEAVGGKAEGLARLVRYGFDVPPGFVIFQASEVDLPRDLEAQYLRIGGGRVAVRSSAVGEDSADASYAGQYETVLNVEGIDALNKAAQDCVRSLHGMRASNYRANATGRDLRWMNVVVQRMVDARCAGVLFTTNPVNARRDQVVIDAVEGLGESLVSGRAAPEHWVLGRDGRILDNELGDAAAPILDEAERLLLVDGGLRAEERYGAPLDMEWAVDRQGDIWWLQARPITGLPADPNELDTHADPSHVFTWCNIGEMMPGAVTPLTYSVTGRGIDRGMQNAYRRSGVDVPPGDETRYVGMYFGHLFLNLTNLSEIAADVAGSTKQQMCIAICGRDVSEIPEPAPAARWKRTLNGMRYFYQLLAAAKHGRELARLRRSLRLRDRGSSAAIYQAIDEELPKVWKAYELHLLSSSSSGALSPILLGILTGGQAPSPAHHAEVAALLAGARDVESADIAEGVDRIIELLLEHPDAERMFAHADPDEALAWLRSSGAVRARAELRRYLGRHGHRAVRELELRQKGWAEDPTPLVRSLQSGLHARLARGTPAARPTHSTGAKAAQQNPLIRALLPLAHAAIRSREQTKSELVAVTAAFKHAYRTLGAKLVEDGLLPDEDALFFLTHEELGTLVRGCSELANVADRRREVLDLQMPLHFPEIFRGRPEPVRTEATDDEGETLLGKPVSRGVVTGRARVVRTLDEAASLEAGEILIASITDVGWTPYFGLIAGLATDVGSAVSHGAVVAREYGLPAVVNLRVATSRFRTGDLVVLDGDRGTLCLA